MAAPENPAAGATASTAEVGAGVIRKAVNEQGHMWPIFESSFRRSVASLGSCPSTLHLLVRSSISRACRDLRLLFLQRRRRKKRRRKAFFCSGEKTHFRNQAGWQRVSACNEHRPPFGRHPTAKLPVNDQNMAACASPRLMSAGAGLAIDDAR
jgi:hypothetical protein